MHDHKIQDAVLKSLNAVGKKAGLKPLEQLASVVLDDEEWTPQNGLLTAAAKLNRKQIVQKNKQAIDVRPFDLSSSLAPSPGSKLTRRLLPRSQAVYP